MRVRSFVGAAVAAALVVPLQLGAAPATPAEVTQAAAPVQQARAAATSVRVITYNIRFGEFGLANLASDIRKTGASIAVLQEVDNRTASGGVHQAKNLARRLGWHVAYDANSRKSFGWRGNAVISKYPIVATNRFTLPQPEGTERRGLMIARVKVGTKKLNVWVTHLQPGRGRLMQARAVRDRIGTPRCATVLGGDFNAGPEQQEHDVLDTHLVDLWKAVGTGDGDTNKRGTARIDFLYTRRVTKVSSWVAPLRHSDHRAVIGNVRVASANSC
ncbi:endonuclease/exonuclease/phosphatase family protein [Nocardioides sp. Root151]|uniref:endonuclease/exonuclease/phosphatase family protein n=1 Tax=Nocardioides sp. Root151 TaxID=1736475 RepID=UPI0007026FBF|nr:endonuclease/exonuclease/phosphatase family protein [Nocardioides sp. Root151]KQZ66887.1 hypothetical protein ASD66_17865 [Nocardioides sp. Root151]